MESLTFEVGHRTTHGFSLLIALTTAALLGFMFEIARPVRVAAPEPAPTEPPAVSEPLVQVL